MQDEIFTIKQISEMYHAVGRNPSLNPDRNSFCVGYADLDWRNLIDRGYAVKDISSSNFMVCKITEKGLKLLMKFN